MIFLILIIVPVKALVMASVTDYYNLHGFSPKSTRAAYSNPGIAGKKNSEATSRTAVHSGLIVRVVSLMLRGEAVAQVRIPHVLVNVVATYDPHKFSLVFHHLGFAGVDPVPF